MEAKLPSCLVVGAGHMGAALLRGWAQAGYTDLHAIDSLLVQETSMPSSPAILKEIPHCCSYTAANWPAYEPEQPPAILVLAVKPQMVPKAIEEWKNWCDDHPVDSTTIPLISMAAGVTLAQLRHYAGAGVAVVRAMPNMPVTIGQGCFGAIADALPPTQRAKIFALFAVLGPTIWVGDETQMDIITALSGSGPAYVFLFIESMQKAAMEMGLSAEDGLVLATQTVKGAALMAAQSANAPEDLRRQVTSPNGTTAAALAVLEDTSLGLELLMQKAMRAAAERSHAIAQEGNAAVIAGDQKGG